MKLNKIAFGIALAAGVGAAQADEVLFPYVVSSNTVTTILSVANAADEANATPKLHFTFFYKEGPDATNNAAVCQEVNKPFSSSLNDLVDVSVDSYFGGATRGILFENGMANATYAPLNATPAMLTNRVKPIRAFAIVDNNDNHERKVVPAAPADKTVVAARATIIEFGAGAAWGYDAFNAQGSGQYFFDEAGERFGEVFSPVDFATGNASERVPVSFKPFDEFVTSFYVTPLFARAITGPKTVAPTFAAAKTAIGTGSFFMPTQVSDITAKNLTTVDDPLLQTSLGSAATAGLYGLTLNATGGQPSAKDQRAGDLTVRIEASVNNGLDVAFDRDENPVSGRKPQDVTCVGQVKIQDLMSTGAQDYVSKSGGWTRLHTVYPTTGVNRTPQASILFLEHNAIGSQTVSGQSAGGVVNNGYQLRQE